MFLLRYLRHMELKQRTGRYALYAIGEIFLVVVGILIALQINNWNEERKQNKVRLELIENLKADLHTTSSRLDQVIENGNTVVYGLRDLLKAASGDAPDMSVEGMRELVSNAFRGIVFQPAMGSYETALSTGTMALISDPVLNDLFAEFEDQIERFKIITEVTIEEHFMGESFQFRKQMGSIYHFYDGREYRHKPDRYRYSDSEFLEYISKKESYAIFENKQELKARSLGRLLAMKEIVQEILTRLESL